MEITARNDYAFKKIFASEENKDILQEFLSAVTNIDKEKFKNLTIKNPINSKTYYDEKLGIVDVKAVLKDGSKFNIEMQNNYTEAFIKRSLFYWSSIYTEDFKKSKNYDELSKTIVINILNDKFQKSKKMHTTYQIIEKDEHTRLDDVFEMHYLTIPNLRDDKGNEITKQLEKDIKNIEKIDIKKLSTLEKWLLFIWTTNKEVRKMIGKEDKMVEKANEVLDIFFYDDKERERYNQALYRDMEKAIWTKEGEKIGEERGRKALLEELRANPDMLRDLGLI